MSILKIIEWPNPILTQKSLPIIDLDSRIQELCKNMMTTLGSINGAVGLSAPQVGELVRILVMKVRQPYIMINPEIVKESETDLGKEGCLSFPGVFLDVSRSKKITVRFQDPYGKSHKLKFTDLEARCILHEIDHLDGIVFTQRKLKVAAGE